MAEGAKTVRPANRAEASIQDFLKEVWQNQRQVVLMLNGKQELLIQDAGSYALLLELVERLETIDGVQRSMDAFEHGDGLPAREALEGLGQKYGLSS